VAIQHSPATIAELCVYGDGQKQYRPDQATGSTRNNLASAEFRFSGRAAQQREREAVS